MHTFLTPEPLTIEVRNNAGDITIELTDTTTTTVHLAVADAHPLASLGVSMVDDMLRAVDRWRGADSSSDDTTGDTTTDPTERVVVHQDGSRLIVDTEPAGTGLTRAFTVRISAPSGSSVRAKSQSADIGISGRADRLELHAASGRLSVFRADGAVLARTASGAVDLASVGGDLDLRTASGAAEVGDVAGNLSVRTTSGSVVVGRAGADVWVRGVSGSVTVREVSRGATDITTVSGDVSVGVAPGVQAKIDLNSTSGSVESEFTVSPDPVVPDEAPDAEQGTDLSITVGTVSGNIGLRPSFAAV